MKSFEHSLVHELQYNGYERLRRAVDLGLFSGDQKLGISKFPIVIDAGCGTGLVGEQFRNISDYLIGVDLSQVILEEAQKLRPNLYDETIVGDVTHVFREKKPISLILSADAYIYFGDLFDLFQSMKDGLIEGGYSAFTLENADDDMIQVLSETKPNWKWQLTASGRFAHNYEYVIETGKKHDLHLVYYDRLDAFRYESGKHVNGHVFILQKRSPDKEL
jgi:predicted TPR repeat methyltransferase